MNFSRALRRAFWIKALLLLSAAPGRATPVTLDPSRFPGADPTGQSDSTQAIQAAVNEAAGDVLILPKGVYTVTSIVVPTNGITISAKGAKLQLASSATEGTPIVRLPATASNIEITGLEIDGDAQSNANFRKISAIKSLGETSHVNLKSLYIHDIPLSAIELSDGDFDWSVTDSRIDRVGRHGIAVDFVQKQTHDLSFTGNTISNCGFGPIDIVAGNGLGGPNDSGATASAGAANVTISRNTIRHNGLDIAAYSPNNRNITVSENRIEDNGIVDSMGHAIHLGGSNLTIRDNVARNTAISAIVVSSWPNPNPTPAEGFNISGNTIEGVLSAKNSKGILVQNASVGTISGNRISGTRECPIQVTGDALGHGGPRVHDIVISNNVIQDNLNLGRRGVCVVSADSVTIK
jgi:hypothetical protein